MEDITVKREEYQTLKEQVASAQLLAQQLEELRQRLDTLVPTPTRTPAPQLDPEDSPARSYKANPPAPFLGDREQIETFLSCCQHVFLVSPVPLSQKRKSFYTPARI